MTIKFSGFIAILGRPNVGKSTLLNHIMGKKISITTPKPQTTRWQILGIKQIDETQLIFIDTPGLLRYERNAMNRYTNRIAQAVIYDTDVIAFVIDATEWRDEDEFILKQLQKSDKPIVLIINKIDLLPNKTDLLPLINGLQEKYPFKDIIPISALHSENLTELLKTLSSYMPEGPALFPEDQITDKSLQFQISEMIREKIISETEQEVPFTTTVMIESFDRSEKLVEIGAVVWVERPGQKVIIIGKGGARLKKIGTRARRDIEKLVKQKVFLRLWVKIKKHWTDDEKALRTLGYGE